VGRRSKRRPLILKKVLLKSRKDGRGMSKRCCRCPPVTDKTGKKENRNIKRHGDEKERAVASISLNTIKYHTPAI